MSADYEEGQVRKRYPELGTKNTHPHPRDITQGNLHFIFRRTFTSLLKEITFCPARSSVAMEYRVSKAYSVVKKRTGSLGGNASNGPIYGELTLGSMQGVINTLKKECEMSSNARFIDIGSGLGKPSIHAAQDPTVAISIGIELEETRWKLSIYNLHGVLSDKELFGSVYFIKGDIDDAVTLDPFTHVYMFDIGFSTHLQQRIANKFNNSTYATHLVSYRPPRTVTGTYGYRVELVTKLSAKMHGSGEGHMVYFYRRIPGATTSSMMITSEAAILYPALSLSSSSSTASTAEVYALTRHVAPVAVAVHVYRERHTMAQAMSMSIDADAACIRKRRSSRQAAEVPTENNTPGQQEEENKEKAAVPSVVLLCDPLFADAVRSAVGASDALKAKVLELVQKHLNSARPSRVLSGVSPGNEER